MKTTWTIALIASLILFGITFTYEPSIRIWPIERIFAAGGILASIASLLYLRQK